jgi:Flp pilus assembly protein TadG
MDAMARPSLFTGLRRCLTAFRSDRRGNLAIIFGFAMLPLIGLVGAGVDYSRAARVQTFLQAAADAAALGSVANASAGYKAALQQGSNGPVATGQTQALSIFNGEINGRTGFTVTTLNANVAVTNWQVTSTVTFTATVPTVLMEVLGWQYLTVTGTSVAANGLPSYIDFYLLLDNSPSMGLAATQADINKLIPLTVTSGTPNGCAFGCHDISGQQDFYTIAKNNNVTMRINVLAQATAQLMTFAQSPTIELLNNQFRMAIYTPGSWGSTGTSDMAKQVTNNYAPHCVVGCTSTGSNPTSSLSAAGTAAAQIDLMTVNANGENNDRGTNFDSLLPAMNSTNIIPTPGNGQGANPPQKVLLIVTDGMADEVDPGNCTGNLPGGSRCVEPLNPTLCTPIKNRGIRIAILYTTYLQLPSSGPGSDAWSTTHAMPSVPNIAPALQACASPGLYSAVGPNEDISAALNKLFAQAVATARLTQ